jgi:hypothetical protein
MSKLSSAITWLPAENSTQTMTRRSATSSVTRKILHEEDHMAFGKMMGGEVSSQRQIAPSRTSKERLLLIAKQARVLFLAYPRSDYDDPDSALATYASVLEGYSDVIVEHVTSPKTGIQRRSKFAPRVAELVTECDRAAADLAYQMRFKNWGNNHPAIAGPKVQRPTLEQMHAKYGKDWGLGGGDKSTNSTQQAPAVDQVTRLHAAEPSPSKC